MPLEHRSRRNHGAPRRARIGALLALVAAPGLMHPVHAGSVFPREAVSAQDEVWVLYYEGCGDPRIDPLRPPFVFREERSMTVEIFRTPPDPDEVCFSAGLPPIIHRLSLGSLPEDGIAILVREFEQDPDTGIDTVLSTSYEFISVRDTPHAALSGIWHAPDYPGVGVTLTLLPTPPSQGDAAEPQATLTLNTTTADGESVWYFGTGSFENAELQLALARGGARDTAPATLPVSFRYEGCRRASIEADDASIAFPSGRTPLAQLSDVLDVAGCEPP